MIELQVPFFPLMMTDQASLGYIEARQGKCCGISISISISIFISFLKRQSQSHREEGCQPVRVAGFSTPPFPSGKFALRQPSGSALFVTG